MSGWIIYGAIALLMVGVLSVINGFEREHPIALRVMALCVFVGLWFASSGVWMSVVFCIFSIGTAYGLLDRIRHRKQI